MPGEASVAFSAKVGTTFAPGKRDRRKPPADLPSESISKPLQSPYRPSTRSSVGSHGMHALLPCRGRKSGTGDEKAGEKGFERYVVAQDADHDLRLRAAQPKQGRRDKDIIGHGLPGIGEQINNLEFDLAALAYARQRSL